MIYIYDTRISKRLEEKLERFEKKYNHIYITNSRFNCDVRYIKDKYFVKWTNSHDIAESFKSLKELEKYVDKMIEK